MDFTEDLLALCLLAAGAMLGLLARTRKFDHTNQFGVQRFATFPDKILQSGGGLPSDWLIELADGSRDDYVGLEPPRELGVGAHGAVVPVCDLPADG
jgi:hypothetical protein